MIELVPELITAPGRFLLDKTFLRERSDNPGAGAFVQIDSLGDLTQWISLAGVLPQQFDNPHRTVEHLNHFISYYEIVRQI